MPSRPVTCGFVCGAVRRVSQDSSRVGMIRARIVSRYNADFPAADPLFAVVSQLGGSSRFSRCAQRMASRRVRGCSLARLAEVRSRLVVGSLNSAASAPAAMSLSPWTSCSTGDSPDGCDDDPHGRPTPCLQNRTGPVLPVLFRSGESRAVVSARSSRTCWSTGVQPSVRCRVVVGQTDATHRVRPFSVATLWLRRWLRNSAF